MALKKVYLHCLIVFLVGCKTVNVPRPAPAVQVPTIEEIYARLLRLERAVVYLPGDQWAKNSDSTVRMTNQRIDTLDVKAVFVGGRPLIKDTSIHHGNDTVKNQLKLSNEYH